MQATRFSSLARGGARAFSTTSQRALARMQIVGRLADKPEVVATSTGREMVVYKLATESGPRNDEGNRHVSWFRVVSFAEGGGREVLLNQTKG